MEKHSNSNSRSSQEANPSYSNSVTRLERIMKWCDAHNLNPCAAIDPSSGRKLMDGIVQLLIDPNPKDINIRLTKSEEDVIITFFENQTRLLCLTKV